MVDNLRPTMVRHEYSSVAHRRTKFIKARDGDPEERPITGVLYVRVREERARHPRVRADHHAVESHVHTVVHACASRLRALRKTTRHSNHTETGGVMRDGFD